MAGAGRAAVALKPLISQVESETKVRARRQHHDPFRLAMLDYGRVQARQGRRLAESVRAVALIDSIVQWISATGIPEAHFGRRSLPRG